MISRLIVTTFLLSLSISAHGENEQRNDQESGFLDQFERVCVETDLNANDIAEFLANKESKRLSPEKTIHLFAGIVPHERHAFQLTDSAVLRYSVQGQVTGANRRNFRAGILAISQRVDTEVPLIDFFDDWDEDYIGVQDCSIIETHEGSDLGPMDILDKYSALKIGWPIERFSIPIHFHGGTQIVDEYYWRFEKGSISLLAGRNGDFNKLSYQRMIPMGVEPSSYSLDAVKLVRD